MFSLSMNKMSLLVFSLVVSSKILELTYTLCLVD